MDKSQLHKDEADETHSLDAWREALREEFKRRRIPAAWQARLMEELDDHLFDLKEEQMSTTNLNAAVVERLGKPDQIAEAAAKECRKLGFFARRPVLTYFVLPIVATPLALIAVVAATMLPMAWVLGGGETWLPGEAVTTPFANAIVAAAVNVFRFVPFALVAWFFARLAHRQGRGWRCVLAACGVAAVYAAIFSVTMEARTATGQGLLMMGLALPPQSVTAYLQAAIPVAIGLLYAWRTPAKGSKGPQAGSASSGAIQVAAG